MQIFFIVAFVLFLIFIYSLCSIARDMDKLEEERTEQMDYVIKKVSELLEYEDPSESDL